MTDRAWRMYLVLFFLLLAGLATAGILGIGGSLATQPVAGPVPVNGTFQPVVQPGVTVTQTSTAMQYLALSGKFWHNSSSSNASSYLPVPVNLTGYTSLSSFVLSVTVSTGAYIPQMVAQQGTRVLFNATVQPQFTIDPTAGTTQVTLSVYAYFTTGGLPPPTGAYTWWANVSESASLVDAQSASWQQQPTTYTIPDNVTAPYGYYLNSTQVVIPFPGGVQVNYSSAKTSAGRFQVTYGSVFAYNDSLRPLKWWAFNATFKPLPATSGTAYVTLSKARLVPGSSTEYTSFGNWTNNNPVPFLSLYALKLDFAYPVDPTSVTVRAGGVQLPQGSFSVSPQYISIQPGSLLTGAQSTIAFQVNMSSLGAPSVLSLPPGAAWVTISGFSLSLTEILVTSMVLVCLYGLLLPRVHRNESTRKTRAAMVTLIFAEFALAAIWALSTLLAGQPT